MVTLPLYSAQQGGGRGPVVAVRGRSQPLGEVRKGFSEELNIWLTSKGRVDGNNAERGEGGSVVFLGEGLAHAKALWQDGAGVELG